MPEPITALEIDSYIIPFIETDFSFGIPVSFNSTTLSK